MEFIGSSSYSNNGNNGFRFVNGCTIVGSSAAPFLGGSNDNVYGNLAFFNAFLGDGNTVIGRQAAYNANNSSRCLYVGNQAAYNAAGGSDNVVLGHAACLNSTALTNNICIGSKTAQDSNGITNVLIGTLSNFNGTQNILIGTLNECNHSNCVVIGSGISAPASNCVVLGGSDITDVRICGFAEFGAAVSYVRTPLSVTAAVSAPSLVIDGHWTVSTNARKDLAFSSKNNAAAYFSDFFEPGVLNFTGQHRCCWGDSATPPRLGMAVSSAGRYRNLDGGEAPTMCEAIPVVVPTCGANDPRVFGVIGGLRADFKVGNLVFEPAMSDDVRVTVNSVGEGAMWVCDEGGPLANGDLITSSSVPGLGCRQADGVVRNYTIAKITCDCLFEGVRHALVGVVYV